MSQTSPAGGPGPYPGAEPAYGGLGKRFGARILDGLIVGIPFAIVFAVIPGLNVGGFLYSLVLTAAYFGYFVFLESSRGSTLGKQILGLRVAGAAGASPVTMEASAIRNSWVLIGLLSGIPVLGIIASLVSLGIVIAIAVTISSDARNQGLHDRFADTVVLEGA